jgi:hypothetical protein
MEITYSVLSSWYEYMAKVPGFISAEVQGSNGTSVPALSEWEGDDNGLEKC